MKIFKFLVGVIGILTIALIVTVIILFNKSGDLPNIPQRGITLNGVESGVADEMVVNFKDDKKCAGKETAIWIKRIWVDTMIKIIKKEHGDGVRMYFAKDLRNKKNTVVIVSTFLVGPDLKTETKADHEDYYDHSDDFFSSTDARLTINTGKTKGAVLFEAHCPCDSGTQFLPATRDDNYITCKDAYNAVQNFVKLGEGQKIDTYSEWFPLSFFRKVEIAFKDEDKKNRDEPADGIRIYFAKHTDSTTVNKNHMRRHALIIVPTKKYICKTDTIHMDYFSDDLKLTWTGRLNMADFRADHAHVLEGGAGDNGEQCKPNCQGATLPAN